MTLNELEFEKAMIENELLRSENRCNVNLMTRRKAIMDEIKEIRFRELFGGKKVLILVVGRSGSGKDTLVHMARERRFNDVPSIPSYTDRPMRSTEKQGREHTFLTKNEFDHMLDNETIFAYTQIGENGYRYCTTVRMLNELPGNVLFYIIDPNGYDYCKNLCNKFHMKVISVVASKEQMKERAIERNGDVETWLKRYQDEDEQFTRWESHPEYSDFTIHNDGDLTTAVDLFIDAVEHAIEYCFKKP